MNLRGDVKPGVTVVVCLFVLGVMTGGGYLWLNQGDMAGRANRNPGPFKGLVLEDIQVFDSARGGFASGISVLEEREKEADVKVRPVKYLPAPPTPRPTPTDSHPAARLSSGFLERLRTQIQTKLEQGGVPIVTRYQQDPDNPTQFIPAPEPKEETKRVNGSLHFVVETFRYPESVAFRITGHLVRTLYLSPRSSDALTNEVLTARTETFCVRPGDLETAIYYEASRLVKTQFLKGYRAANAIRDTPQRP